MAAVHCTSPSHPFHAAQCKVQLARCLHPSPGRFGDNIISSGNSHRTAWKTRFLLQRSQVRLQDASSRSQTFITGDFEPSKFKWNQIERAQDILRCLIRLIRFISFDFIWFRLILKIRLNLPVCFLPFTRLDPLFETFWARTWRPWPNRPHRPHRPMAWRTNGGAISEELAGRSCMTWTWKRFASIRARFDAIDAMKVTAIKPHTTAAARQGQFLIAAAWIDRMRL